MFVKKYEERCLQLNTKGLFINDKKNCYIVSHNDESYNENQHFMSKLQQYLEQKFMVAQLPYANFTVNLPYRKFLHRIFELKQYTQLNIIAMTFKKILK